MCVCVHVPGSHLSELISSLEEASIVGENETYPRALLHWNRAASQGTFVLYDSSYIILLEEPLMSE